MVTVGGYYPITVTFPRDEKDGWWVVSFYRGDDGYGIAESARDGDAVAKDAVIDWINERLSEGGLRSYHLTKEAKNDNDS